jgi:transglutaminase-like putative cysteine protease
MVMELRISHTTGFEYDDLVSASYNEARMTPQTSSEQIVVHARVEVMPHPWTHSYRDYWGTLVTGFEVLAPHRDLTVTATSTVHTMARTEASGDLDWAALRDPGVVDSYVEFLEVTARVDPPNDLVEVAADLVGDGAAPAEVARAMCAFVYETVEYRSGATDVHATARDAWQQRQGVCQDFAHLALGAIRHAGIPARYVSGYLLPTQNPAIGTATHGESHAWIEWWDGAWHAFDPTNDQPPCERHVTVATGRDYGDVRPLSGIYTGAAASRMFVDVQVTRLT